MKHIWKFVALLMSLCVVLGSVVACDSDSDDNRDGDDRDGTLIERIYENLNDTGHCKNINLYSTVDSDEDTPKDIINNAENAPQFLVRLAENTDSIAVLWAEGDKNLKDSRYDEFEVIVFQFESAAQAKKQVKESDTLAEFVEDYPFSEFVEDCVVVANDKAWLEIALEGGKPSSGWEPEETIELIYENMENTGHCEINWLYRITDDPKSVNSYLVEALEKFPGGIAVLWSEGDKDLTDDKYDEFEIIVIEYETAADARSQATKSEFYQRHVIEKGSFIAEFVNDCIVFAGANNREWLEIALEGID